MDDATEPDETIRGMTTAIAEILGVGADRIRYGQLPNRIGKWGTTGDHWMI